MTRLILSILTLVPEVPTVKTLEFPSTFIKVWYACEELESNAKCDSFEGYFIDVRNMHDCYMKFDKCVFLSHVRNIGMKSVTYGYQFFTRSEELLPILHGVKFTKCEIYGSTKLRTCELYMLNLCNKNV